MNKQPKPLKKSIMSAMFQQTEFAYFAGVIITVIIIRFGFLIKERFFA